MLLPITFVALATATTTTTVSAAFTITTIGGALRKGLVRVLSGELPLRFAAANCPRGVTDVKMGVINILVAGIVMKVVPCGVFI